MFTVGRNATFAEVQDTETGFRRFDQSAGSVAWRICQSRSTVARLAAGQSSWQRQKRFASFQPRDRLCL